MVHRQHRHPQENSNIHINVKDSNSVLAQNSMHESGNGNIWRKVIYIAMPSGGYWEYTSVNQRSLSWLCPNKSPGLKTKS